MSGQPTSATPGRPVLVGVDGSPRCRAALAWAAHEAASRGVGLRLVYAYLPVMAAGALGTDVTILDSDFEDQGDAARGLLEDLVAAVGAQHPELDVEGELIVGSPSSVLLDECGDADLVVLGSRGAGGLGSLLLGSVSMQVSSHATVPTVVVRSADEAPAAALTTPGPTGPVVVGIDGSGVSRAALDFGIDYASRHGLDVVAVHAVRHRGDTDADTAALEETLRSARAAHPDLVLGPSVVAGTAEQVLSDTSSGAALLVIGSRGRGGFRGLLLGSVSHAMLQQSQCPVAVVRNP